MARYTGPKHKLARREGINVLDKTSVTLQRRLNIPPGIHGKKRKRALSEYGQQLREKQRAKATYGMLEKQFGRLVADAQKLKGESGEMLIALLETRLDNIVYRLGFANSRFQARQFVTHGHVLVNGKKLNIPSYRVRENEVVTISGKMIEHVDEAPEGQITLPFLKRTDKTGKLLRMPTAKDVDVLFDTQLIIEYYSR